MSFSSLYNHAQSFVKTFKAENIEQDDIDAVIVEYINLVAQLNRWDKRMYTDELRSEVKFCTGTTKEIADIKRMLITARERMLSTCISYCINDNCEYNNCNSKCTISNEEARNIIDSYINTFIGEKIV